MRRLPPSLAAGNMQSAVDEKKKLELRLDNVTNELNKAKAHAAELDGSKQQLQVVVTLQTASTHSPRHSGFNTQQYARRCQRQHRHSLSHVSARLYLWRHQSACLLLWVVLLCLGTSCNNMSVCHWCNFCHAGTC